MRITILLLASWVLAAGQSAPLTPPNPNFQPGPPVQKVQPGQPAQKSQQESEDPGDLAKITTRVINVIAPTTVLDKGGAYVNNIKPHEFRLLDNGKDQEIKVEQAWVPMSMVVCVQADSMVEAVLPKIQKIGSLLESQVLGESGQAALIAFDHRIRIMQEFTKEGDKISAALKKINPGSSSSRLNDAVLEAARMLRHTPKDQRRVILLIAETRDKGSEAKAKEVLTEMQFQNISVYTVNINRLITTFTAKAPAPRPDPIPPGGRHLPAGAMNDPTTVAQSTGQWNGSVIPLFVEIFRDIKAIFISNPAEVYTKFTGGRERSFTTQGALESAISDIGEELHSQYMISYNPNNKIEGGFHEIKIEVARPGLNVRTRPGYWMAGVPE